MAWIGPVVDLPRFCRFGSADLDLLIGMARATDPAPTTHSRRAGGLRRSAQFLSVCFPERHGASHRPRPNNAFPTRRRLAPFRSVFERLLP